MNDKQLSIYNVICNPHVFKTASNFAITFSKIKYHTQLIVLIQEKLK